MTSPTLLTAGADDARLDELEAEFLQPSRVELAPARGGAEIPATVVGLEVDEPSNRITIYRTRRYCC
jgi:hypothetical protein